METLIRSLTVGQYVMSDVPCRVEAVHVYDGVETWIKLLDCNGYTDARYVSPDATIQTLDWDDAKWEDFTTLCEACDGKGERSGSYDGMGDYDETCETCDGTGRVAFILR